MKVLQLQIAIFAKKNGGNSDLTSPTLKRFRETGAIGDLDTFAVLEQKTSKQFVIMLISAGLSIQHRGQELEISRSSLRCVLTKDFHLHANKVQSTQEFKAY